MVARAINLLGVITLFFIVDFHKYQQILTSKLANFAFVKVQDTKVKKTPGKLEAQVPVMFYMQWRRRGDALRA